MFLQLNELPPVGHFHIGSYFLYAVFGWFRCKSTVYKFNPSLLDHQLSLKMEKAISTTENQGSSMSIFYVLSVVTTWHFHSSKTVLDFMAHKMVQTWNHFPPLVWTSRTGEQMTTEMNLTIMYQ